VLLLFGVAQLRHALPRDDVLVVTGTTIGLHEDTIVTDMATFAALVPQALRTGGLADLAARLCTPAGSAARPSVRAAAEMPWASAMSWRLIP
jgi:hypothetical protein